MRVCYLIDNLDRAGTESQLLALVRHLDRTRVEPILCLLDGENEVSRALEPGDCPVYRLGIRSLHHLRTLSRARRLVRLLRAHQVDVLQAYFPDSTLLGAPVARLAGVPHVVRTRNNLGYSLTRLQRWLGRHYRRFVDVTIANCEACREAVLEQEHPSPDSVVVLENGVDLSQFPIFDSPLSSHRPRCVGMVANLRPIKAPDLLVRAAAIIHDAYPDVVFRIAGEGELRPELERLIRSLGLDRCFHLPGAVADVPAFLAEVDVAVLCSRSEGQSNALLEYMAAGRAVVATSVGGNGELIESNVNGLLTPPGNAGALADAVRYFLDHPEQARAMGAAGRRLVEERFSLQGRARRFENFYESLVGQR